MRVMADAAGLDTKTVGADFYAADYTDPFHAVTIETGRATA